MAEGMESSVLKGGVTPIALKPNFSDLLNPETFLDHVQQLVQESDGVAHEDILNQLLVQVVPIDFEKQAFPQLEQLRQELTALEEKLINPDGSLNSDKDLGKERDEWKALKRKIEKLKVTPRHMLIIAIEKIAELANQNNWGLCKNHDFIYVYNGAFWCEIDKEAFKKFLGEAAEKMGVAKFTARYYQFRDQLLCQFLSTEYLPTPQVNIDNVFINLKNGTFEVKGSETRLRPFERSDFLTYQLPFAYDPKATAPVFQSYLDKVLPDKERQLVLSEYLGFLFIKNGSKSLKEEKALILYGTGANGKSVFFEVVNALLGAENVSSFSLQSLTNETGYFRAKIANKLVNYASEINGKLETAIFKQLVSGEPVEARLPYGQPFILKQYAKLIFNCNELPKDVEHTNAYFRRFLIIPFDVTIPPEEQDKNLHSKIIDCELSGVFNWVLEGLNRLLNQKGFSECDAARQVLEQYKIKSDSVKMFLEEFEFSPSHIHEVKLREIFDDYKSYCADNGFRACSTNTLSERLRNSGYTINRKSYGMAVGAERKRYF
jgi:putative DNA primase/helicase